MQLTPFSDLLYPHRVKVDQMFIGRDN